MKLHYLAIAAVTAISANIGTASAAVSFTLLPTYLNLYCHRHLTSHLALSANLSLLGVF
jgi:hypothetical protein